MVSYKALNTSAKGSIKTLMPFINNLNSTQFQFHKGSIKTLIPGTFLLLDLVSIP